MTNHDVVDALKFDFKPTKLQLSSFCAIEENMLVMQVDQLTGWISFQRWSCCSTAQYGYFEFHTNKKPRLGRGFLYYSDD